MPKFAVPPAVTALALFVDVLDVHEPLAETDVHRPYFRGVTVKESTEAAVLGALCKALFDDPVMRASAQTAFIAYLTEWNRLAGVIGTVETPSVAAAELVALQPVVIDAALRVGCLLALLDQPALPPLSESQPFKEWLRGKVGNATRDAVAASVGVDERTLDGWLDDEHAPKPENLKKLAAVLAGYEAPSVSPFAEFGFGNASGPEFDANASSLLAWWLKLAKIVERIIGERAPIAPPMQTQLQFAFAARRLARALEERFGAQIYLSLSEQFVRIANAVAFANASEFAGGGVARDGGPASTGASRRRQFAGRGGETDVLFIGAMGRGTSLPRLAVILEELAANEADPVWRTALREFMTPSARCDLRARLHAQSLLAAFLAASDAASTEDAEDRFYLAYFASADLGAPPEKLREWLNVFRDDPRVPGPLRALIGDALDDAGEALGRDVQALLAENRYDAAIETLTRALAAQKLASSDPAREASLRLDRASVYERAGEFYANASVGEARDGAEFYANALDDYEALIARDHRHAEALDRAAHLHFRTGNRKRAKELAKRAYELGRMTIHSAASEGYYRRTVSQRPPTCTTDPPFRGIASKSAPSPASRTGALAFVGPVTAERKAAVVENGEADAGGDPLESRLALARRARR